MSVFEVWDVGDDASEYRREYEADDAEGAAIKFAEDELDNGRQASTFELVVRDEAGVEHAVDVTIEWTPDFYAFERPAKAVQP